MRRLLLGLLLAVALSAPGWAQSPAANQVAAQIGQIMQQSAASASRSSAMANDLHDPLGGSRVVQKADEVVRLTVLSTVISAIAANPAETADIVVAAINAAPSLRNDIVATATSSYPAFAPTIYAVVGGTPVASPSPIAAPTPPAAPVIIASPPPPTRPAQQFAAAPPRRETSTDDAFGEDAPAAESFAGAATAQIYDPIEPVNRAIFAFNDVLDRFLIRPIAYGYGFITPEPVKQSVRNFFSNLRAPIRFANDVLQFESGDAAVTGGRFLINTTVGVLGFLDVADVIGLEHHPADFGQTLHRYSVGAGPYIVIPVLGPSTLRDGVGIVADTFMDPLTYLLEPYPRLAVAGVEGIVKRETLIDSLDELRAGSLDYYAALRAAYYQDRAVVLNKGRGSTTSAADDAFGSFE